jgi:hypothetical protein
MDGVLLEAGLKLAAVCAGLAIVAVIERAVKAKQFNVRTLLILMTLASVMLGLLVIVRTNY